MLLVLHTELVLNPFLAKKICIIHYNNSADKLVTNPLLSLQISPGCMRSPYLSQAEMLIEPVLSAAFTVLTLCPSLVCVGFPILCI